MSILTLILGESGTGKTASLRNLDPGETLLIQVIKKPLPFKAKGWANYSKETKTGNIVVTDSSETVIKALKSFRQPVVVIDDFQYLMSNEFMNRSDERGFDKFSDIARHAWDVLRAAGNSFPERRVYIMSHSQSDEFGHTKIKTIGKLLDDKITIEGMVTICLRTIATGGEYKFSTQNNGLDTCKSPIGMFPDQLIDNDLAAVDAAIHDYYFLPETA